MDPLSIISGVAGVAMAGSTIASVLYDMISNIRDAPSQMIDIARGIRELSSVLKELRGVLKKGRKLFKDRLYRSVRSATRRIEDIHEEIDALLDHHGGGLSRVIWQFRKSKATNLLAKIETHKSTVQLIATTMLLAVMERKHSKDGDLGNDKGTEPSDERRALRREAATLVRATEHSMQDLLPQRVLEDKSTQTEDYPSMATGRISESSASPFNVSGTETARPDNQIAMWTNSTDDTARWLYELVFRDDQPSKGRSRTPLPVSDVLVPPTPAGARNVVDRLLLQWTNLTSGEIIGDGLGSSGPTNEWEARLESRVRLLELTRGEDAAPPSLSQRDTPTQGTTSRTKGSSREESLLSFAADYMAAARRRKPRTGGSDDDNLSTKEVFDPEQPRFLQRDSPDLRSRGESKTYSGPDRIAATTRDIE
ncbi:hypothetical protein NKR23_g8267 [Pleurostoma richardsiae]|uniref:Fungal N-terminal domain-containing protein n=1 Tax=Pleurostoma richardsiae TaxID=41990 RepID=A0AA38VCZ1_9PEZI|nr:hypothetical protein NKR23_g8267 [Pleurostoma richardsiae]